MRRKRIVHFLLASALIFCASTACADDQDQLPKYGSMPRTAAQKAADAKFIAAIDKEYHGDRKKASTELAKQGWRSIADIEPGEAMRRFNHAWLLDNSNGIAIWGMAAIEAGVLQFDDSLKLFAEAEKFLGESNIDFSVDYAKTVGTAGVKLKNDAWLKDAFVRFERVYKKAPQNVKNLQNWAITLYGVGRYSDAWTKVKLAEAAPDKKDLDPYFLKALESKMPRPK